MNWLYESLLRSGSTYFCFTGLACHCWWKVQRQCFFRIVGLNDFCSKSTKSSAMAFLHSADPTSHVLSIFHYLWGTIATYTFVGLSKCFVSLIRSVIKFKHCLNDYLYHCSGQNMFTRYNSSHINDYFKLVLWNQLVGDSEGLLQNIFEQLIIDIFYKFVPLFQEKLL